MPNMLYRRVTIERTIYRQVSLPVTSICHGRTKANISKTVHFRDKVTIGH